MGRDLYVRSKKKISTFKNFQFQWKILYRLKTTFYKLNTLDEVENAENETSLKWVRYGFKSCAAVQL